jgi:hypothetical protein
LTVAKSARAILDTKLKEARDRVGFANDKAKKAARGVIAAELQESLISEVVEAKSNYIESVGRLRWLHLNHALVGDQHAARQLIADMNTPISAAPEASTAGVDAMEQALAALLADASAKI